MSQVLSLRVSDELLAEIDGEAEARDMKRQDVAVERLTRPSVPEGLERLMLSKTQIQSLDQTAERWGKTRIEAIQRMLTERILREFVEERQRQAFGGKKTPVNGN